MPCTLRPLVQPEALPEALATETRPECRRLTEAAGALAGARSEPVETGRSN